MTDLEAENMESLKAQVYDLEDKVAALELERDELQAALRELAHHAAEIVRDLGSKVTPATRQ